jgi:MscS family membrane protein
MNPERIGAMLSGWAGDYGWMLQAFGVVFATLIVGVTVKHMLTTLAKRTRESRNIVDDAFFSALTAPVNGLIWIVGVAFAAHIIGRHTEAAIFDAVNAIREIGIVAMIMWFSLRFVRNYETRFIEVKVARGEPVDQTLITAIGKLVRAAAIITALLIVLQTMGINIAGLLAFGGVGGIAVGLAARDILANVFGGLTVYLDRPFAVGDWIRSPDKEIEGTVEEIGWRRTVIRTFDMRPLYVPNAMFTNISVENPSRMLHRRIFEKVGVRYDDVARVPLILEDIRRYLLENPDIEQAQTLMVNFNEFGASSLDFFIYAFTKTRVWTEFHMIKEQVLLKVADIITSHGGEIAFPTTTVHVADEVRLSEQARSAA